MALNDSAMDTSMDDSVVDGVIILKPHERILKEVFVVIDDSLFKPDLFDECAGVEDQVDTLWVLQLSGYSESLPAGSEKITLFQYCIDCYHRVRAAKARSSNEVRKRLLEVLERFCVKYAIMTVQSPDIFPCELVVPSPQLIAEQLTRPGGLKAELLAEFVAQLAENDPDDLKHTLAPAVAHIAESVKHGGDDFGAAMAAIAPILELAQHKIMRPVIASVSNWLPKPPTNGKGVQQTSLLGILYSFSVCPGHDVNVDVGPFSTVTGPPRFTREVLATIDNSRAAITTYHHQLHAATLAVLSSKETKNQVLNWLALAINMSKKRTQDAYTYDNSEELRNEVGDDGFHLNLVAVMVALCKKYTSPANDVWPPSFAKIQPDYLQRANARVDVTEETILGEAKAPGHHLLDSQPSSHGDTRGAVTATPSTPGTPGAGLNQSFQSPGGTATANFVTESFFMTVRELHVGLIPAMKRFNWKYNSRQGHLYHYGEELKKYQKMLAANPNDTSFRGRQIKEAVAKLTKLVDTQSRGFMGMYAHLADPTYISSVLDFYAFLCAWLIELVDPENKGLPLADEVPMLFGGLPAHVLEDLGEFLVFTAVNAPDTMEQLAASRKATFARFMAIFIGDTRYIRNPYVVTKFVKALASFSPGGRARLNEQRHGSPPQALDSSFFVGVLKEPTSEQFLFPALMRFFVNIEETDSYERGEKRQQAGSIMKSLWDSPPHRAAMVRDQYDKEFLRFIMLLINDTLDQLDEARNAVTEMIELADKARTTALTDEETKTMEQKKATAEYYFKTGKENVDIFTWLTTEIYEPLLTPELVERLSIFLNYNLKDMVTATNSQGRRVLYDELKVEPTVVIVMLAKIYVNVSGVGRRGGVNDVFLQSVVRDGRSFELQYFKDAPGLVNDHYNGTSIPDVGKTMDDFAKVVTELARVEAEDATMEEDLGEIPDEYLCPIMSTLMRDPVILPSSKQNIDRATISAHLLTNPRDPFNRAALRIEDVIPNGKLKAEIDAWVAQKKAEGSGAAAN